MSKLGSAWFRGALIGLTFVVVPACEGKSVTNHDDDDDGTPCGKLAGKLKGCDLDVLLPADCKEPDDDENRCVFECIFDASCAEIRTLVCSDTVSASLDACVSGCSPGPFTCGDGSTVPEYSTCDGYPDCLDGSDERANCPTCGNGETYPDYARCDGYPDCSDGADENRCPAFTCANGETVPESLECDDYPDCTDASDEHARCPGFICGSGERIPEGYECDGEPDCSDGSDEHARCPRVTCADGTTVSGARCDESFDCPDYSDEPSSCPPSAEDRICGR